MALTSTVADEQSYLIGFITSFKSNFTEDNETSLTVCTGNTCELWLVDDDEASLPTLVHIAASVMMTRIVLLSMMLFNWHELMRNHQKCDIKYSSLKDTVQEQKDASTKVKRYFLSLLLP